jgi:hypothetical protein
MDLLAQIYENGWLGVSPNTVTAHQWKKRAKAAQR